MSSLPEIKQGTAKHDVVKELQTDLNKLGVTDKNGHKLAVDGFFGPLTNSAVRKFQKEQKIGVDGIVGPVTWSHIQSALHKLSAHHDYKLHIGFAKQFSFSGQTPDITTMTTGETAMVYVSTFDGKKALKFEKVDVTIPPMFPKSEQVLTYTTGTTGVQNVGSTAPVKVTATAKWKDPAGVAHTQTATLTITMAKVGNVPIPSDDKLVAKTPAIISNNVVLLDVDDTSGNTYTMQLDTGAFELMLTKPIANKLKAPNLGTMNISGVGGNAKAYKSKVDLVVGGVKFSGIDCVVNESFTGLPLFGFRFFQNRGFDVLISQKHKALVFMK